MSHDQLMNLSPLDGRYRLKMEMLRPIFSEYGLMNYRVEVEIRWLQWLAQYTNIMPLAKFDANTQEFLENIIQNFSLKDAQRIKAIERDINHDVKAVEYFIKEKLIDHEQLSPLTEFIHFGCTSEDINNIAHALMLYRVRETIVLPAIAGIIASLQNFAKNYAHLPMLARTHGQAATPTTIGKEFANIVTRLTRQCRQLDEVSILAKFNGASGNYNALVSVFPEIDWPMLNSNFITSLNLEWNGYTTQIEPHDYIAEYFHCIMRINTILLDFNRDIWSYISLDYLQLKVNENEVGSSAMPHKINPIDFENAEGNLGLSNALLEHMAAKLPISRFQRDLSDSTVLRNMGVALGYALMAYQSTLQGLSKISPNVRIMQKDLDNHWEILAEPIQTMMRVQGIDKPYEQLKNFTRGQIITKELLHAFIHELPLDQEVKDILLALRPENYIGMAEDLAKRC